MKRSLVAACMAMLATPMIAGAGAGDPRLVNGMLEWPAVVTSEAFVIVRGDDGGAYYVAVPGTRREAVKAGTRVVVIGIEGRTPHEITAVGFGSGPTTDAAMAQLLTGRPPAAETPATPATSSVPANGAPNAATATTPAAPALIAPTIVTPAPAAPTTVGAPPAAPTPAGATAAAPAGAVPAPAAPTPVTSAPAPAAPAAPTPAVKAPTNGGSVPAATQPAPAPAPATPRGPGSSVDLVQTSTPPAAKAATIPPTIVTTVPMLPPRDDQRWVELVGEVESVSGRTLVLRTESGRVNIDASSLRSNLERTIVPGSTIKVYGLPVELRFKAMGFIDPGTQTHGSNSR
jgi:hypothetical protein